jgi:hypothetical protein
MSAFCGASLVYLSLMIMFQSTLLYFYSDLVIPIRSYCMRNPSCKHLYLSKKCEKMFYLNHEMSFGGDPNRASILKHQASLFLFIMQMNLY